MLKDEKFPVCNDCLFYLVRHAESAFCLITEEIVEGNGWACKWFIPEEVRITEWGSDIRRRLIRKRCCILFKQVDKKEVSNDE